MSVLWVTSFNEELFEVSGKELIKSFYTNRIYGDLFIGFEGLEVPDLMLGPDVIVDTKRRMIGNANLTCRYEIEETEFAKKWRIENQDIIPVTEGGQMRECTCPDPWARQERLHEKGCHHTWFNRNTYRWVNKIFTLHEALIHTDKIYDYIIWIDADCTFTKQITSDFIEEVIFDDCKADLTILRGLRNFLEAGLVGYNIGRNDGCSFLVEYLNCYLSKEFRTYLIWDDCHILEQMIKIYNPIVHNLANRITGKFSDVFEKSLIGDYITHDKGRHGRKLGIMK